MRFKPKIHTPLKAIIDDRYICMDYLYRQSGQNLDQYQQMQMQIAIGIIKHQLGINPLLKSGHIWDADKLQILEIRRNLKTVKIPKNRYAEWESKFKEYESLDAQIPNVSLAVNNDAVFLNYKAISDKLSPFAQRMRQFELVKEYLKVVLLDRDDRAVYIYDNEMFIADCYNKKGEKLHFDF